MQTLAALSSAALKPNAALRVMPAGHFRAYDGRPGNAPSWFIDRAGADAIVAALNARQKPFVIDYEHQTLNKISNGQPAPAAGWFDGVEWREGDGLYITGVKWIAKASAMIASGEYRYLSPVFPYEPGTGTVHGLHSVALTNDPALVGLSDLAAASAKVPGLPAVAACSAFALTEDERRIAAAVGVTPEQYAKAKAADHVALTAIASTGLTDAEVRMAASCGLTPAQYAKAKAS